MPFDPDEFMQATIDQPLSDRPLLPTGDYVGTITVVKPQAGQQRKDPSKDWHALNVQIEIDTNQKPGLRELLGQDRIILFDFVGLDMVEGKDGKPKLDSDKGRNRQLKRYLDAADLNAKGSTPGMLQGRMVSVRVGRDEYEGRLRESVESVGKVA